MGSNCSSENYASSGMQFARFFACKLHEYYKLMNEKLILKGFFITGVDKFSFYTG